MPLYEYTCGKSRKRSEHLVRSGSGAGVPDCPHCGSRRMKKELSGFAAGGGGPDPERPVAPAIPGTVADAAED
ncbi:MAG: hypothetical protein CM1200mP34_4480 [Verrucomicrobiales bacterium]|nr:MAG: hypothetical protein CM1200mP34_4480 [Verrucomicrobiales bacterium]